MDFKYIQNFFFFLFLGVSTILFFYIIKDFWMVVFWALVLAIIFYPSYLQILKKTKEKKVLASSLTLILITFSIVAPVVLTLSLVAGEAIKVAQNFSTADLKANFLDKKYEEKIDQALLKINLNPEEVKNNLANNIKEFLNKIGRSSLDFGKSTLQFILSFFLMLYLIFFFLKDGKQLLTRIAEILPLGNKIEMDIFNRFSTIVKSIFKGTLIVALVQGSIGGILFFLVGVESAILWWVLMVLLSVVPAIGPSIILIPAAILFFLTGGIWQGIVLILGAMIVSVVDNILRPILVGHDTKMPDLIITLSIFGGLVVLGIIGLIVGPVLAGIFITAWQAFEEKFQKDLNRSG